jgi:hypothetical protein
MLSFDKGKSNGRSRKDQSNQESIQNDNADIAWPSSRAQIGFTTAWRQALPNCHKDKDTEKKT